MPSRKFWNLALYVLLAILAIFLFVRFLLPLLLPFLIGLALALVAQRPIRFCTGRLHFPRPLAVFLCLLLLFALLGSALFLLGRIIFQELSGFLRELPTLLTTLSEPLAALKLRLYALAGRLPDGLGSGLRDGLDHFFQSGSALGSRAYSWLFSFASGFLTHLPSAVLFVISAIVSSFMLAADLPRLRRSFSALPDEPFIQKIRIFIHTLRSALGGWLIAQFKLMGITFLILAAGFLFLCTDYPLLFALLTTLIDALPVFGVGTVLIPCSLLEFLHGNTGCGLGFLILYALAALTRQALEPRLIGQQIGLSPVITLFALYAGYRILGVAGMILFPITAILIKQLCAHSDLQNS